MWEDLINRYLDYIARLVYMYFFIIDNIFPNTPKGPKRGLGAILIIGIFIVPSILLLVLVYLVYHMLL
jgi:hypothetical protein